MLVAYAFGTTGLFLIGVPWTSIWSHLPRVLLPPEQASWVASGWLRGAISALGVVDFAIGIQFGRELWRRLTADARGARR